jgi:hypothetical protein
MKEHVPMAQWNALVKASVQFAMATGTRMEFDADGRIADIQVDTWKNPIDWIAYGQLTSGLIGAMRNRGVSNPHLALCADPSGAYIGRIFARISEMYGIDEACRWATPPAEHNGPKLELRVSVQFALNGVLTVATANTYTGTPAGFHNY